MSADPDPARRATHLDGRAAEAERSVSALFEARLGRMPLTHLARVVHPAPRGLRTLGGLRGEWHYWWQAHYLDAIVDAALRHLRRGDGPGAELRARRGDRVLATVRLRNGGRWVGDFYDDMAWLALASGRLAALHERLGRPGPRRRLQSVGRHLTAELQSAHTDDAGGGLFWSRERDFKNSPTTGPAALHLARTGETAQARRLVDWLYARLWSPESGLVRDGIRLHGSQEVPADDLWSYNQGPLLGTLVMLGDDESRARAAALVAAVDAGLTTELPTEPTTELGGGRVLRTHGGHDGGLFTGILARYLAVAAVADLPDDARATARRLVHSTAEALWRGRGERQLARGTSATAFPTEPGGAAPTGPLELSPQLQAWTVLEAAATLA